MPEPSAHPVEPVEPVDAAVAVSANGVQRAPFRYRLATRIGMLSLVALVLVLAMIGGTLWLSWQLEGAGASINDAGSLRMRANAVGITLEATQPVIRARLNDQLQQFDATLRELHDGDPARPLFLPNDARVRAQFDRVATMWAGQMKPAAQRAWEAGAHEASGYLTLLPGFIGEANLLVSRIEHENARKTTWLRMSQLALAALSCVGVVIIVWLLYLWFVAPTRRLQEGLARVQARRFDTRLAVERQDEFGLLAQGFNQMVAELQALYHDLTARVEARTAQRVALSNQLAVLEERNLVAQGLHDSIAQDLSFMKMQVHQLESAAQAGNLHEIRNIVPMLVSGVNESYDDVRELLLNFRTKLRFGELRKAVEDTIGHFRRQSEADVTLDYHDENGPPLPADQQLQVLFILQEALSNVRKHAHAKHVHVSVTNANDFRLCVEDDGVGYDEAFVASRSDAHVGVHIMRERAHRLSAMLQLHGAPAHGARVELVLPAGKRTAA